MIEKMDFDIGSLIYIVITIVAVIAGIAGKKKKQTAGSGSTGDAEGAEGTQAKGAFFGKLETQLERFAEEARQSVGNTQQEAVIEEDEVVVERDYFESMSDDYDKKQAPELLGEMAASYEGLYSPDDIENDPLMEAEGIRVTDALELIHLDEDQTSLEDQQIIEEFDARTAIIYSAIINRIEI